MEQHENSHCFEQDWAIALVFLSVNAHSGQKTLPRRAKTVMCFVSVAALFFTTVNQRVDDSGPCV